jgi:hypothetical protein
MVVGFTITCAISAYHHLLWVWFPFMAKFVSDLRQVGGLLMVLRFPSPMKLTWCNWEILLEVALNQPHHITSLSLLISIIDSMCKQYTVEPVWSDTWVFRHPVTSDKNFRSQNISLTFFVKKPWSILQPDTVLLSQC